LILPLKGKNLSQVRKVATKRLIKNILILKSNRKVDRHYAHTLLMMMMDIDEQKYIFT
jgi:hypothetical protein